MKNFAIAFLSLSFVFASTLKAIDTGLCQTQCEETHTDCAQQCEFSLGSSQRGQCYAGCTEVESSCMKQCVPQATRKSPPTWRPSLPACGENTTSITGGGFNVGDANPTKALHKCEASLAEPAKACAAIPNAEFKTTHCYYDGIQNSLKYYRAEYHCCKY